MRYIIKEIGMKKQVILTLLLILVLPLSAVVTAPVRAQDHSSHYTLNGYCWNTNIEYYVEQELINLGWLPVIEASFAEWRRHAALIVDFYVEPFPTDQITPQDEEGQPGNSKNEIRLSYIDGKDGSYGWTTSWHTGTTYDEFDIFLDKDETWSTAVSCPPDKVDVLNILTHEVGHALGLADYNCYDETMYSYKWGGSIYGDTHQRTLFDGDKMGIMTLYGIPEVGGIWVPVDKLGLLAPYIGLTSTISVAAVSIFLYAKRVTRRKRKQ